MNKQRTPICLVSEADEEWHDTTDDNHHNQEIIGERETFEWFYKSSDEWVDKHVKLTTTTNEQMEQNYYQNRYHFVADDGSEW